jgi:histone H3/H4
MQWCCFRVLKEVHPDVGISKQGMQVMQTFAVDMFDRIMVEASRLCRISNKATLSSREIQTAGGPMPHTNTCHKSSRCHAKEAYLPMLQ